MTGGFTIFLNSERVRSYDYYPKLTFEEYTSLGYNDYDKYLVDPDDVSCTSQLTNGRKEVTLITCTNDNKQRYIIKAREM